MITESAFPPLPALRCLGAIADTRVVIVVDNREQEPLQFINLASETGTLQSGDYSFRGAEELFAVERKSIGDLVGCCVGDNRERFFRELHRLRGFKFKRLVIVGSRKAIEAGNYRSKLNPKAVFATLSAVEVRYDVPVVFAADARDAALLIESWAFWFAREMVEGVNDVARAHGLTQRKAVEEDAPPPASAISEGGAS